MTTGDSPAVARRRLRIALRKARQARGLTQGQVAEALVWSLSKVNRIESGEVTISNTDLQALLGLLDVVDKDQVDRLMSDARAARRRGWWDEPRYREHLSPATHQVLQFESEASAIRGFHHAVFPGLLQTQNYGASVINEIVDATSEETRATRVETRLRRQEQFFARVDSPQLLIIIDEFVPYRTVGNNAVMAEQLRHVAEVARLPNVLIRMLPKEQALFTLLGDFTIFDLGEDENAVLYREAAVTDELVHGSEMVKRYRLRFEQMWEICLKEDATISAIEAQLALIRAAIDRGDRGGL
jgi:transcriptional regulator with XRE-family HTH domain